MATLDEFNFRMKDERKILELIGRFYKEKNLELIRPYLHSNIIYASAWVQETLYGTKRFLSYITGKLKSQEKNGWEMDFYIHTLRYKKKHFIILKQNNDRNNTVVASVEFKSGKIYSYHEKIYSIPHIFSRTGKYTEKQITYFMLLIELVFSSLIWLL